VCGSNRNGRLGNFGVSDEAIIEQYNEMVSRANCGVFMISVGDTPVEESGGSNPFLEPAFGEPLDEFLAHLFVFRTSLPVQSEDLGTLEHRGEIPIGTLNVFKVFVPEPRILNKFAASSGQSVRVASL
jgi:hypothetical protein